MHYHIRYMHVKYQLNRDKRFVKIVNIKNKLNCNSNFEKLILSDMHHPIPNICVEFETYRLVSYSGTAFQSIFLRATDRRTDAQTDRRTDGRTAFLGRITRHLTYNKKKFINFILDLYSIVE